MFVFSHKRSYLANSTISGFFQGSIFVTARAQEHLKRKSIDRAQELTFNPSIQEKLRNSKYGSEHEIEAMASGFDRITKCTFNSPNTPCYIKFGGLNYNDPKFDIRSGSIKIAG
jgi:hypothetical protein